MTMLSHTLSGPPARRWIERLAFVLGALSLAAGAAFAAPTGKVQGKVVGSDNGEPIGFADVVLIPADTTMHRVGGYTNSDGTYLIEVLPGRYVLQVRAL